MAFLHPHTLKGIAMTFWLVLLSSGIEQTDCCTPYCTGSFCVTVYRIKVDFESADNFCRWSNGELLSLVPNDDISIALDYGGYGNFWIGLSLPDGMCSNLSAPLRGYKWSSNDQSSNLSFNFWEDSVPVCSPRCVSTSHDLKWTERLCSEEIDGFLCRTDPDHACQIQEVTDYCSGAPCEQDCTVVKGGYRCSCYDGFVPDSEDSSKCKFHCAEEKCPSVCDVYDNTVCFCPDGYMINGNICEDIDECEMQFCEQKCTNTYGSFRCSCFKGFVLRDQVQCKPTTEENGYLDLTPKSTSLRGSLSTGAFICTAVIVIVFVCVVRWYALKRQKRAQQNTLTQGINIEL